MCFCINTWIYTKSNICYNTGKLFIFIVCK